MNAFAARDNVEQVWSEGIAHGELVRTNTDQTMTIDPWQPLEYLFQENDPAARVDDYINISYRLGVITAKSEKSNKRTLSSTRRVIPPGFVPAMAALLHSE
jgi:endo-1,4-beta-xylanase